MPVLLSKEQLLTRISIKKKNYFSFINHLILIEVAILPDRTNLLVNYL